jgi:hypothetical protein
MMIVSSLFGLETCGLFSMYSYVSEDKLNKFSLIYMEQFSLGSQFKEAFPFPLGSRFFKMR